MTTQNIPNMERRQKIAADVAAHKAASAEADAIEKPFNDRIAELEAERDAAVAAYEAQREEFNGNWPDDIFGTDDDGYPETCAATGLVLLDDDEYFEDGETGEKVLRGAVGLPPRHADDNEADAA